MFQGMNKIIQVKAKGFPMSGCLQGSVVRFWAHFLNYFQAIFGPFSPKFWSIRIVGTLEGSYENNKLPISYIISILILLKGDGSFVVKSGDILDRPLFHS